MIFIDQGVFRTAIVQADLGDRMFHFGLLRDLPACGTEGFLLHVPTLQAPWLDVFIDVLESKYRRYIARFCPAFIRYDREHWLLPIQVSRYSLCADCKHPHTTYGAKVPSAKCPCGCETWRAASDDDVCVDCVAASLRTYPRLTLCVNCSSPVK